MTNFTKGFGQYVCDGDTIETTIDGVTYTARLMRDIDTQVSEFECYDRAAITAWENDEWHYFGVVIDAERDGWTKTGLASLWGIEGNFPGGDNAYFLEVANDLLSEAIATIKGD